jgi:hypothetical protein
MLFRTADFSRGFVETGDPTAEPALVNGSYLQQQRAGLRRMMALAVSRPASRQR